MQDAKRRLDDRIHDNQIYRFAAMVYGYDDPTEMTAKQLNIFCFVWFGLIAFAVATLGPLLALCYYRIKFQTAVGRTRWSRLLQAVRRLVLRLARKNKIVRTQEVEKIVERKIEVPVDVVREVVKEVPVEQVVTVVHELVKEVPVDRIDSVEKPVEVKVKEVGLPADLHQRPGRAEGPSGLERGWRDRMDGTAQVSHERASLEIVSHNYAPFNAAVAKYIEKLEQPDPRIAGQAFREKTRGVGHVLRALGIAALLTLIGASLVVLCQQRSATNSVEINGPIGPPWPTLPEPPPTGGPEKVVINYTLFTTVHVAERIEIVTGWRFAKSTDDKPESQYCYLSTPQEFGSRKIDLAYRSQSGPLVQQTPASEFKGVMREIDYETALTKCRWFSG